MMLRYESSGFKIESGADFRRIFLLGNSQSAIAEASIRDSLLRSELKEVEDRGVREKFGAGDGI